MCNRQRLAYIAHKILVSEKQIERIHNGLAADSIADKKYRDGGGKGRRPTMNPKRVTQTKEGTCWSF